MSRIVRRFAGLFPAAALAMFAAPQVGAQEMILIEGARVFDGTGSPAKVADVLVDGDRIAAVGKQLDAPMLEAIREAFPQPKILVRAYDRRTLVDLRDAPVDCAVRELHGSAITMGRAALEMLGDSIQDIDEAEQEYRRRDDARLDVQIEAGDYRAAREMVITEQKNPTRWRKRKAR